MVYGTYKPTYDLLLHPINYTYIYHYNPSYKLVYKPVYKYHKGILIGL